MKLVRETGVKTWCEANSGKERQKSCSNHIEDEIFNALQAGLLSGLKK